MNRLVTNTLKCSAAAAVLFTVGGCGRNIPDIEPTLLDQKPALLMLASMDLPDNEQMRLKKLFHDYAKKTGVATEWIAVSRDIPLELRESIRVKPYNGILVVGDELLQPVSQLAEELPEKRVLLLGSTEDSVHTATYGQFTPNVGIKYYVAPEMNGEALPSHYNWSHILAGSMDKLLLPEWKGGRMPYTEDEVK